MHSGMMHGSIPKQRTRWVSTAMVLFFLALHCISPTASLLARLDGLIQAPQAHSLTTPIHRLQRACLPIAEPPLPTPRVEAGLGLTLTARMVPPAAQPAAQESAARQATPLRI